MPTGSPSIGPNGRNVGDIARDYSDSERGFLKNLWLKPDASKVVSDTARFMFYPSQIKIKLAPKYTTFSPAGFSGEIQNFSNTSGPDISFDVYMNALLWLKDSPGKTYDDANEFMEQTRRFLEALSYPADTPSGVVTGDNPPCILCLPGLLSLRVKLQSLNETSREQDQKGRLRDISFSVVFKEAPLGKVTMNDHMDVGMFRTWGQ